MAELSPPPPQPPPPQSTLSPRSSPRRSSSRSTYCWRPGAARASSGQRTRATLSSVWKPRLPRCAPLARAHKTRRWRWPTQREPTRRSSETNRWPRVSSRRATPPSARLAPLPPRATLPRSPRAWRGCAAGRERGPAFATSSWAPIMRGVLQCPSALTKRTNWARGASRRRGCRFPLWLLLPLWEGRLPLEPQRRFPPFPRAHQSQK
mmetsp:Transcript_43676/g.108066  ORF Transcript_43676/g.108066 Transcript_43676/m.108066 type:complete len:207 (-) Transcript_43676:2779-3399(-)